MPLDNLLGAWGYKAEQPRFSSSPVLCQKQAAWAPQDKLKYFSSPCTTPGVHWPQEYKDPQHHIAQGAAPAPRRNTPSATTWENAADLHLQTAREWKPVSAGAALSDLVPGGMICGTTETTATAAVLLGCPRTLHN